MKKKMVRAAAMLCGILLLCACGGQNNGWHELLSVTVQTDAQGETEPEWDEPEEEMHNDVDKESRGEMNKEDCAESRDEDGRAESVDKESREESADREGWTVEPLAETLYVRVDGCKVKKGPGEKYETVGTLVLLEELRVTGKTTGENGEEWYQIVLPEMPEYGSPAYIKAEEVTGRE